MTARPARPTLAPLLLAGALLLLPGCALKTTILVMDAEQAVSAAEAARADELATHDMTMARAYMQEAQRLWAHSQYAAADRLALESRRLAEAAAQKAAVGGDPGQEALEDAAAPPPQPVAPPVEPEPDDSELMQLIEEGKEEEEGEEKEPSILQDEKLDTEIFDEDSP